MKYQHTGTFIVLVPRHEIDQFETAVLDKIPGATIGKTPCTLTKYSVTVHYPIETPPQAFVDLGTRFNELLHPEKPTIV